MLETLYFSCYQSFLSGNQEKTRIYYDLLRDEFKQKGTISSLDPSYLLNLKKIKTALDTGASAFTIWVDEQLSEGPPPSQEPAPFDQKFLVKKIDESVQQLSKLLEDDLYLYNLEHPCEPYGNVDMVYMGKKTIYPLEVKKEQGRHDLIGQIYKYDLYHKMRLRYKFYKEVQSVTICQSYDAYTLNSLKRLSIKTMIYSFDNEKLFLKLL